ncbi:thioredoxin-dependent thiol peroxidase [Parvularcula dongshanensis]|uniref:thioredoxin-dependent peroxiredoxin n=1 Tax=Parvularcula dongshanensis TaxID=1173995 RepID=A0A840I3T6_9PROT|nr:thioredoxin-dependent thiol peroxidase [Parvularcula dongshanensis]MBB4659529.1 peroxiredoxin Q/BCP [Parvularcula dongshanensis]
MLQPGDEAPDFTLDGEDGQVRLADFKGKQLVLYFYPKDDTAGCTKEAIAFSEHLAAFGAAGTAVLGISKDSPQKHEKFRRKHDLTVPLASDEDGAACEAYGVWTEKSMYGRTYMGIERSTFLIAADGRIAEVWRKVRVPGHAEAVLKAAQSRHTA